ncbi:MAG: histidine kinase [Candidatus Falkowbacteria bacterium GW2011_GWC2_38_22]|uniref:Histidine kinase n=1 Tax=Candidatus Falkowbacteria bacterium GW2011_GWE1_38_31 TaxID=1618638 RepID=A0A0G0JVI0_9BACT|nr:MAG: histidine kinase [Candidatus Falkowbacteria bacterium GW2011_GWF2_38_1205]KKQ61631.1 MAG: histidine kinase [Candidatus Falkowbacteria bacterium GW2011_GWC2_38_22]KKQ63754.1 MAG: histidine kinase [Candidatus Falkowbacteria bacterium GW2011_GWF1_38_22]KKQ65830.1 MAG: histidine kinase [Candidatus Falkowbacteria bacterium GW2011_GWE2_38_254]KKQ70617.1 MAG: histidine kinase [Candidatus Falkowbacteria bacterium GW2011_GWE1_38_31]KKQ73013.1 MAG: histidine kinase [Candidatus Falkowbacteria bac
MDKCEKIYIIEDDANIMAGLLANFRIQGFEINGHGGYSSKESILNEILAYQPDYIILDLILPKVDGFKLLHDIKANDFSNNIPVIIFTDFSEKDFKTRSLQIGADYFFVKTDFQTDVFVEKVLKIIENRRKL